jgi:hypothetical protein
VGGLPVAFNLAVQTPLKAGRDTGLAWAPFWLPAAALLALTLLPFRLSRARSTTKRYAAGA